MTTARRGLGACVAALAATCVAGDETPPLPPEWFAPPKTASELGITRFSQSPFLDRRDLPPVEDRLPNDPVVIQPYRTLGKYGGTARITLWDTWQFFNWEHALTISADLRNILPNLAESWSLSEDGRVTTIRLRPGIKWSDGVPLTADDFIFRMNHVWLDPQISPVTYRLVRGVKMVKIDDLTFQYVFPEPNPMFANFVAQYGSHFATRSISGAGSMSAMWPYSRTTTTRTRSIGRCYGAAASGVSSAPSRTPSTGSR